MHHILHTLLPYFHREITHMQALIHRAAMVWKGDATPTKSLYAQHLQEMLALDYDNFQRLTRGLVFETLKEVTSADPNFFLCRLLYLAKQFNLESCSNSKNEYTTFPLHIAHSIAHGKRIMLTGKREQIRLIKHWLFRGTKHAIFKRFSSHNVAPSAAGAKEKIGLWQAMRSRDYGLNLAILGNGNSSPFNGQPISYDGHHGSACIVKKSDSKYSAMLFGIENSAPLKKDQQGNTHGPSCTPKDFSAFFLPKFGSAAWETLSVCHDFLPQKNTNCLRIQMPVDARLDQCLPNDEEVYRKVMKNLLTATPTGRWRLEGF